jgi:hypothetical protein
MCATLASAALGAFVGNGACDQGPPANPIEEAGPAPESTSTDGSVVDSPTDMPMTDVVAPPVYAVCPDGMAPAFSSLLTKMFATSGCGAGQAYDCHSSTGALPREEGGTGSGLDFAIDAAAVYAELLGDGGGAPSNNINGDAGGVVLRVAPGDPAASLLYIKLAMPNARDPRYGEAMPPTGLPCPSAVAAVGAWIEAGAPAN